MKDIQSTGMTKKGKDTAKRLQYQFMEIKSIGHRLHSRATDEGFWFDFCFTAIQHILGHFGRGQLT